MQNSELYRRGFVVPLNEEAQYALMNNNVDEETEVSFFEIPNDQVFDSLWVKGFFEKINTELGLMIDDYEEEIVENIEISKLREVVRKFKNEKKLDYEEIKVVTALEELSTIAIARKSKIFFIM